MMLWLGPAGTLQRSVNTSRQGLQWTDHFDLDFDDVDFVLDHVDLAFDHVALVFDPVVYHHVVVVAVRLCNLRSCQ